MRYDFKDIIIERPRYGSSGGWGDIRNSKRVQELDDKVSYRKMHLHGWLGKEFSDRLKPIIGMLRKNVGRPWDKVWSEICKHADSRNIRGYHLRDHILDYVLLQGKERVYPYRWSRRPDFYVDDHGILRETKVDRKRPSRRTRNPDHKRAKRLRKREEKAHKEAVDDYADWILWKRKQEANKKRRVA